MNRITLFLVFTLSVGFCFSQQKVLADDSLVYQSKYIGKYSNYIAEDYFELKSFRRFQEINNSFLPVARTGNNGLANHSFKFSAQEWSSSSLLNGFSSYLYTKDSLRFYKTSRPFTQLSYFNGSGSEQQFTIFHTQNLGEGMNLAFNYRRINSEGIYFRQLATHTQFNATVALKSRDQRFSSDLYYLINNLENQENAGILVSDNNVDDDNPVTLSVNLSDAQNQSKSQDWGAKSEYVFITKDSTNSPLFSISHEFNWLKASRLYSDNLANAQDFYAISIFDELNSEDSTSSQNIANEVRFNFYGNVFQFGIRNEQLSWFQNQLIKEEASSNFLLAELNKQFSNIGVVAKLEKGISGFHKNEIDGYGHLTFTNKNALNLRVYSAIKNKQPDLLIANQRANHNYYNLDFKTSKSVAIGGVVKSSKLKGAVNLSYTLLNDFVVFDSLQTPKQYQESISVIQLALQKDFKFLKNFRFDNNIQLQYFSNEEIIPLPALLSLHSLYYTNDFFSNSLRVEVGADLAYIGAYDGYAYSPSLAQFYLRNGGEELGNRVQVDLFVNLRIHKSVRVFAKYENITDQPFEAASARVEDLSVPGRLIKFGLSWRMLN